MGGWRFGEDERRCRARSAVWLLTILLGAALPSVACCQNKATPPSAEVKPPVAEAPSAPAEPIIQAGCASCGDGLHAPSSGGCGCGNGGRCYPGKEPCECCDFDNCGPVGRLFGGIVQCICCPDPCYDPRWYLLSDAAFFTDAARPVTQMRLRAEGAQRLPFPDKAEWFWARSDGMGKLIPPNNVKGERRVDHSDLYFYTEGATGRIGLFVELDYRHLEPEIFGNASGFADRNVGTKTLLLDCELLQVSFQFRTYLPTGNFTRGLGTGHVSMDLSLPFNLKLAPETCWQGQLAYLFPIGGDQLYQGRSSTTTPASTRRCGAAVATSSLSAWSRRTFTRSWAVTIRSPAMARRAPRTSARSSTWGRACA